MVMVQMQKYIPSLCVVGVVVGLGLLYLRRQGKIYQRIAARDDMLFNQTMNSVLQSKGLTNSNPLYLGPGSVAFSTLGGKESRAPSCDEDEDDEGAISVHLGSTNLNDAARIAEAKLRISSECYQVLEPAPTKVTLPGLLTFEAIIPYLHDLPNPQDILFTIAQIPNLHIWNRLLLHDELEGVLEFEATGGSDVICVLI